MKQPDLGKRLAQIRKKKNLSQEELTERCHVSVRTIQRIESGEVTPRGSTVRILMAALDFNYEELKEISTTEERESGWTSFLAMRELPHKQMINVLQVSWIAGIAYFVIGIIEGGMDYAISGSKLSFSSAGNSDFDLIWKAFYSLVKLMVAVSYFFFARGFVGSAVSPFGLGIMSIIGYTPDVFMSPLMGYLLDSSPGSQGHQYVFLIMTIFGVVGLLCVWILKRIKQTKK
ncbi:MAG: helix-turn-helix transcriptional regulator [Bacteroidota bacterium]